MRPYQKQPNRKTTVCQTDILLCQFVENENRPLKLRMRMKHAIMKNENQKPLSSSSHFLFWHSAVRRLRTDSAVMMTPQCPHCPLSALSGCCGCCCCCCCCCCCLLLLLLAAAAAAVAAAAAETLVHSPYLVLVCVPLSASAFK